MTSRIAIIGFEHVHAPHYLECMRRMPEIELTAIVETADSRLAPHAEQLAGIQCLETYQSLLSPQSVDGVIVCSANSKHKQAVLDFARAGVPILCEKPIATRTEDAREMLAICQAHGVSLGICFPCRFSEPLHQAKRLINESAIGKIVAVNSTNRGTMPGDWFVQPELSGGGAVIDHTVHIVDVLRWLFEAEFTRVQAYAATRLHEVLVEDVALLTLEMSNEVFITLDTSWSRPNRSFPIWGDVELEFIGTTGVLSLNLFPWTLNLYSEAFGKHLAESRDGELNRRMIENFISVIRGESVFAANGKDGLRALEIVEAAYNSIATGHVVDP